MSASWYEACVVWLQNDLPVAAVAVAAVAASAAAIVAAASVVVAVVAVQSVVTLWSHHHQYSACFWERERERDNNHMY